MGYIYKIENQLNHKIYIGQTKRTVKERWLEHLHNAIYNKKLHSPLYKAFIKYGIENFSLEQIEECDDKILDERETYWIEYFDSYNKGYNATLGGQQGKKLDYQLIVDDYLITQNVKLTAKNLNCNPATVRSILNLYHIYHQVEIPIEMLDPNTFQVIETFSSLTEASQYKDGWLISTISSALNGRRNSAYGFFWRKQGDTNKIFKPLLKRNRKIGQFDKDNNLIQIFDSVAEANRKLKKPENHRGISNAVNGRTKTSSGFIWKYLEDEIQGEENGSKELSKFEYNN